MKHLRSTWERTLRSIPLLGLTAVLLALVSPPRAALAHPLDAYLQATYITVAPTQIVVELDLTPGVLVAPQVLAELDSDGDQEITDAEGQAYADTVLRNVTLQVDGQPRTLAVTRIDMPAYLNIQAGYGTIRIFTAATLADGMTGTHQISYTNNNAPIGAAYQVNAFVENGAPLTLGTQNRDGIQQSMTLVAAYLVGSRGTVGHAVALGAIVTFTHTASVIVIGLLALFPSQFVVPNVLVPILEILSGVLVVSMGARLVWQRWAAFRGRRDPDHAQTHDHGHHHDHGHTHDHKHSHDHGDGHPHSHLPPAEGFKLGSLVAMGVSGGLVPCPEALGIMIIAIGLNRVLLGLALIVAFSVGLAAVLIVIGVLLVRSRELVERFGSLGGRLSIALPLGSAVIVTVLGVGITLGGLASYLR